MFVFFIIWWLSNRSSKKCASMLDIVHCNRCFRNRFLCHFIKKIFWKKTSKKILCRWCSSVVNFLVLFWNALIYIILILLHGHKKYHKTVLLHFKKKKKEKISVDSIHELVVHNFFYQYCDFIVDFQCEF